MSVGMGDDLLGPLMEWPDVLREHVLKKLNPTDLSLLSLTNKRVRAAVEESGRPISIARLKASSSPFHARCMDTSGPFRQFALLRAHLAMLCEPMNRTSWSLCSSPAIDATS